jgi:hypothetical protein
LKGRYKVFQVLLGGGKFNRRAQLGRELALLFNAFEHGFAALFELAQVTQPVFEFAQLDVVQPAGGLLAVARDKGHGGAAVEQLHGRLDLVFLDFDFCRDLADDFLHRGKDSDEGFEESWELKERKAAECRTGIGAHGDPHKLTPRVGIVPQAKRRLCFP